jgi:chemotaxis protein methyltransferase CheR
MVTYSYEIPPMTASEQVRFRDFIEGEFGIKMPATKKSLLENRLYRRVEACGLKSYGAYLDFVTSDAGSEDEFLRFSDLVSTHETSFFRESAHFDYLKESVLPSLCRESERHKLSILSAACSTGEEAYCLGMIADAALNDLGRKDILLSVEGLDLSSRAISIAQRGVYLEKNTLNIPDGLRRRYFMVSKDKTKDLCRVVPELRQITSFHTGNLLGDTGLEYRHYDIIFCRNVLIYFNQERQGSVITMLIGHLYPGGLLFLGHAESIIGFNLPASIVSRAVFRKN